MLLLVRSARQSINPFISNGLDPLPFSVWTVVLAMILLLSTDWKECVQYFALLPGESNIPSLFHIYFGSSFSYFQLEKFWFIAVASGRRNSSFQGLELRLVIYRYWCIDWLPHLTKIVFIYFFLRVTDESLSTMSFCFCLLTPLGPKCDSTTSCAAMNFLYFCTNSPWLYDGSAKEVFQNSFVEPSLNEHSTISLKWGNCVSFPQLNGFCRERTRLVSFPLLCCVCWRIQQNHQCHTSFSYFA